MKKKLMMCLFLLFFAGAVSADYVVLEHGEIIEGSIVKVTDVYVRIDTITGEDGRVKEFLRDKIQRYDYGKIPEEISRMAIFIANEQKSKGLAPVRTRIGSHDPSSLAGGSLELGDLPDLLDPKNNKVTIDQKAEALNNPQFQEMLSQAQADMDQLPTQEEMESQLLEFMESDQYKSFVVMSVVFMVGFFLLVFGAGAAIAFFIAKKLDVDVEEFPATAGFWRRIIARFIDFSVAISLFMSIVIISGLIVPFDLYIGKIALFVMLPGMLLFFWYLYFSPATLNNTYGRYVTNVKILDGETNKKPSFGQVFKRELLTGFWPIEIFVILFNKTKRRIGDCWAGTYVTIAKYKNPWFVRVVPGVLIVGLFFAFINYVSPLVNDNMVITQTAKEFLERKFGEELVGRSSRVEIVNAEGYVTFKLSNDDNYEVYLVGSGQSWIVRSYQKISERQLGVGFSISKTPQ